MGNIYKLDFNDAQDQIDVDAPEYDVKNLEPKLLLRLPEALSHLFPHGKIIGKQFKIGNIQGDPGDSLVFELEGEKAGVWFDFESKEKGNIWSAWAYVMRFEYPREFPKILDSVAQWLGETPKSVPPAVQKPSSVADLGHYTEKWDYHDRDWNAIVYLYRFDLPNGGKEYRPWDVAANKWGAPTPRPLYNLPRVLKAKAVILVEGEKCAQALIDQGIVATTAMFGANAPVDKTDWSPLQGKRVIIWPDKDKAGWEYAEKVEQSLLEQGIAVSVSILRPPEDKPEKWDAADAVEERMDIRAFLTVQLEQNAHSTGIVAIDPVTDWVGLPPTREWIIRDWLPKGYVTALYGDGGVGKSLLAQQLMTSIATGKAWMDVMLKQRRVYGLMCEDDPNELWRRQYDINAAYGLTMKDLSEMRLVSRVGENNLLMTFDGQDAGTLTPFFDLLLKDISAFEAEVIVLDTAADLFAGNENNRSQVRQFVQNACARIARETGGAVLLCAHPSDAGITRGTGTGGSTAWNNTVRSRWYFSHNFRPEAVPHQRLLSRKKSNYSTSRDSMDVVWASGTFVRIYPEREEGGEVEQKNLTKADKKKQRNRQLIIQILRKEAFEKGKLYTAWQFARTFQGHKALGCERSIKELIATMATQQVLHFCQTGERYGLKDIRKGKGYLCQPGMLITVTVANEKAKPLEKKEMVVIPTHTIDAGSGELVPYEADEVDSIDDDNFIPEDMEHD